jgi:hypothetical protein
MDEPGHSATGLCSAQGADWKVSGAFINNEPANAYSGYRNSSSARNEVMACHCPQATCDLITGVVIGNTV